MKLVLLFSMIVLSVSGTLSAQALPPEPQSSLRPYRLRCEHLIDPIGLDVRSPRLSWALRAEGRGAIQSAYRIQAASSLDDLESDAADLWDSGRTGSREQLGIVYNGRQLRSGQRCWWRVMAWDRKGHAGAWSDPAFFEMGLLDPSDWQAQWIGFSTEIPPIPGPSLTGARWIWCPGDDPPQPDRTVSMRRSFVVDEGATLESATLALTADNRYELFLNGTPITPPGRGSANWKQVQRIDVKPHIRQGVNQLAVAVTNTDGPGGFVTALGLRFRDADPLELTSDAAWRVTTEMTLDGWTEPGFDDAAWPAARECAAFGEGTWNKLSEPEPSAPCPYLRRDFTLEQPVARARLHATALGVYELSLNGLRVGAAHFTPGWTDYTRRLQVQTFDVTGLLREGANAIGAILGDGWYAGAIGWDLERHHYGPYPLSLLAQMEIELVDGTVRTIVTGPAWRASSGPILASDFLMGETYDARLEMPGWDRAGFDDRSWRPVEILDKPRAELSAQRSQVVRRVQMLSPRTITEPRPGVYIFDMRQNMVGWARFAVKGKAGDRVRLRFGEMLSDDGTLYTENLRGALSTDTYILRGGGAMEVFEPRFTFHGFRYVEVTGYPGGFPPLEALCGVVVHSDTPRTGSFSCSSALVNRLYENILWGQRGNFLSVPTDCPQRDERLGWMGDAQIFAPTACFNMDVAAFFTKWMKDVEDAQSEEGAFPNVAPRLVTLNDGAPAWGDAGIIVPWTCLLFYGDRGIVERHYGAMQEWIEYILEVNPELVRRERLNDNFGDWVSLDNGTPKDLLATAYFARCARLMARMARSIGREDDAHRYDALFNGIRDAFQREFVDDEARLDGDTQTCYVLALNDDLLLEEQRDAAVDYLVAAIEAHDDHVTTGFLGVGYLLPVLSRFGRDDVAYRLLLNETYPSWGYCIRQGATTIWERWDGWTEDKGFQDPGMNSFNHYSFGAVGEWLYETLAGIAPDPERPGFEHVQIQPRPGGGLTFAAAALETVRGTVSCAWRADSGRLTLRVTIPANSTATVWIPSTKNAEIREGGEVITGAEGVILQHRAAQALVVEIGSGEYSFEVREGE